MVSYLVPPMRVGYDVDVTARKADLLRLAGSYDLRMPSSPRPSALGADGSAAEKAKAAARWAFAGNQSMTMRALHPGLAAVDRLLR